MNQRELYRPLRLASYWMLGTFVLFLAFGDIRALQSPLILTLFVVGAFLSFLVGYRLQARKSGDRPNFAIAGVEESSYSRVPLNWIFLSAGYTAAFALASMAEFGVNSPAAILQGITDPGSAYFAKFQAYELQLATASTNSALQALTLTSALGTPLAPFLVIYWRAITTPLRAFGLFAIGLHVLFYVAIGTLVGLGTLVLGLVVGLAVARARRLVRTAGIVGTRKRRNKYASIAMLACAMSFVVYMTYNQSARIEAVGGKSDHQPNPVVEQIFGRTAAVGASATVFYPTHGYIGLDHSLSQPFEWTKGRGASRAIDGYLTQYGFGESQQERTYPARTEVATGRDAGLYWSTIYPWLASDLTFPGAILFMAIVGWWTSRFWRESVERGRNISVLMLGQMAILIAFIPANNQLVIGRGPLLCFLVLLSAYVAVQVNDRFRLKHERPARTGATFQPPTERKSSSNACA